VIHVHDILRERLLAQAGLTSQDRPALPPWPGLDTVYRVQWCPWFERAMRDRMAMGWFRYGPMNSPQRRALRLDHVGSAMRRLKLYLETGCQEHLVDAANLCMVEVMIPSCHQNPHFKAADDANHTT